jgi:RNA polymerase sigma factor (sigma-70 family)
MKNYESSSLEEEDPDDIGAGEDENDEIENDNDIEADDATPDDIDEEKDSCASGGSADTLDHFFRQLNKPKNRPMPKEVFAALARRLAGFKSSVIERVKEIVGCRMLEDESHDRTMCQSCSNYDALARELVIPGDLNGFCGLSVWANGLLNSEVIPRLFRFFGLHEAERILSDMCRANFQLVVSIAKRSHWRWKGIPLIELIQEGNRGLVLAVIRFDPGRGFQFSTFASWWIWQYIMREPHDYGRPIRIPIHAAEFFGRICRIAAQDDIDLNAAGDEDIRRIAAQMASSRKKIAVTEKIIRKTLVTITTAQSVSSLDRKINREEGGSSILELTADATIPAPNIPFEEKENSDQFMKTVAKALRPREWEVLNRRLGLEDGAEKQTLKQIAETLCLSRERVRQIETSALNKLRRAIGEGKLIDL